MVRNVGCSLSDCYVTVCAPYVFLSHLFTSLNMYSKGKGVVWSGKRGDSESWKVRRVERNMSSVYAVCQVKRWWVGGNGVRAIHDECQH